MATRDRNGPLRHPDPRRPARTPRRNRSISGPLPTVPGHGHRSRPDRGQRPKTYDLRTRRTGLWWRRGNGPHRIDLRRRFVLAILRDFIIPRNLGLVSCPDGMFRLFPGLVREPDVAYISWERVPGGRFPTEPIGGFAPDLAVEVLSISNTKAEMARKRREYFGAGVRLVWEVDPRARTATVYESPEQRAVLDASMSLDGGTVLPGFVLPLGELFSELDRTGDR